MKRTTLSLIGLLSLLGVVAYLVTLKPGERSVSTEAGEPLFTVDSALVVKVEIRSTSGPVTLERRGVEWFVAAPIVYKANAANVASLLDRVKDLRVKGTVSNRREKHGLFQVDSAGTHVTVYQGGKEQASFVVGKASASFTDTYVRAAGSDEVAIVDGSLGWMFNRSVRDWRDKTILSLFKPDVKEIGFRFGDTTFTLSLRDSAWMIDRSKANAATVENLLTSLLSLQCDDFLDTEPAVKPGIQITAGGVQVLFAFDKGSRKYYVRTSASPQWYILETWRADQVLKRKKDLV